MSLKPTARSLTCQAEKMEDKLKLLGSGCPPAGWGVFHVKGVGAKYFGGMSLETQGNKHFGGISLDFCWDVQELPERLDKKLVFNFWPLSLRTPPPPPALSFIHPLRPSTPLEGYSGGRTICNKLITCMILVG